MSVIVFWSTSRITGTSRPFGVSTATPMCTYFLKTIDSFAMSTDERTAGSARCASATILMSDGGDGELAAGLLDARAIRLAEVFERR